MAPRAKGQDILASKKIADVLLSGFDKSKLLNKRVLFGRERWITD
jgi:hypothetical protein